MARFANTLVMLASVLAIAAVAWFFGQEYARLSQREQTLERVSEIAKAEGPCVALAEVRGLSRWVDRHLARQLETKRTVYVGEVVGVEDVEGRRAYLSAERQELLGIGLCEQIRLMTSEGRPHPVLAMLRVTQEGADPCEQPVSLEQAMSSLGAHRPMVMRHLLSRVKRFGCLSAELSRNVALNAVTLLHDDPRVFDDLDVSAASRFLIDWAPAESLGLACRLVSRREVSRIAETLGCSEQQRQQTVTQYKAPTEGSDPLVQVRRVGNRCDVVPAEGEPILDSVACSGLEPVGTLHLAIRADVLSFGVLKSDMLVGLGVFDWGTSRATSPTQKAPSRTWYGYNRDGAPQGTSHAFDLHERARDLDIVLPNKPLTFACREKGAQYCYDVDWSQTASHRSAEATVFLSRAEQSFLDADFYPPERVSSIVQQAFGATYSHDGVRIYPLHDGTLFVLARVDDKLRLAWQRSGQWVTQTFGEATQGSKRAYRLLAALDFKHDAAPELILQEVLRVASKASASGFRDKKHVVHLVQLDPNRAKFSVVNSVTLHEYE